MAGAQHIPELAFLCCVVSSVQIRRSRPPSIVPIPSPAARVSGALAAPTTLSFLPPVVPRLGTPPPGTLYRAGHWPPMVLFWLEDGGEEMNRTGGRSRGSCLAALLPTATRAPELTSSLGAGYVQKLAGSSYSWPAPPKEQELSIQKQVPGSMDEEGDRDPNPKPTSTTRTSSSPCTLTSTPHTRQAESCSELPAGARIVYRP